MNKNLYEKPNTDVLVIRFEDNILSGAGADNQPGKGWGTDPGDDEIINGGSF